MSGSVPHGSNWVRTFGHLENRPIQGIVYIVYKGSVYSIPERRGRPSVALGLAAALLASGALAQQQNPAAPSGLKVDVLEGEGAINNIQQRRSREPVVRVVNDDQMPVSGASVTFTLPDMGPSGAFTGDIRTLTVLTNESGQAVGRGLAPNQSVGKYQIRVTASYRGQMANAVINQTNAAPGGALSSGPSKKILLIALIGGAAAGGAAFAATRGGGGSNNTTPPQPAGSVNPTGIVITTGTPVFQPPH